TKALVLELLAAVCLVRGGHEIILSAFDNFKEIKRKKICIPAPFLFQVCKEKHRFERLMDYFRCEEGNIDFMVGQYIVEDMNFRVHLQFEFTKLGLDDFLEVTEKLLEVENETMMKVADLETLLLQKDKDLQAIRETYESTNTQVNTLRRMIKEKDAAFQRQVNIERRLLELEQQGTIRLHKKPDGDISIEPLGVGGGGSGIGIPLGIELDLEKFEELFKTRAQGPVVDLSCTKSKVAQKTVNKVTLLDANRSKNLAITLRKANKTTEEICKAIEKFDLKALPVDFVECLMRFLPTEAEVKVLRQYERERRPLDQLAEEDRFMLLFSKIERLTQRMNIITFVGNFTDSIGMLTPQLNAIIAASGSVKSSPKLKRMLEVGSVSKAAFKLLDTKSTDRKMTLLHYIALIVKEKYPELANFYNELHFVNKAAAVSLENVLLDVRELSKGMELIRRECSLHDHPVLKGFVQASDPQLDKLQRDAKTAEEAFNSVVSYFGESAKTTPPSVFFPVFVRFIKAYKVRMATSLCLCVLTRCRLLCGPSGKFPGLF
ncbi:hypothetical protein GOODEAATRI_010443, partial [Goodea atripinnis]